MEWKVWMTPVVVCGGGGVVVNVNKGTNKSFE